MTIVTVKGMKSSEYLLSTSKEYAIYVAQTRAIPRVQDGLKSGQRAALFLLCNRAEKLKTVALGGQMAAVKIFVHGEASATNSINLLAAVYKNNCPLIKGHGQFGSRVSPVDGIGSARYTEVQRSKYAEAFLYTDMELAPQQANYDDTYFSSSYFLPLIPTVLLNGIAGVAVGFSTEILPRSLNGLIQASQDALAEKKTLRGLVPHFERYDITVKTVGLNQYEFYGKARIEDSSSVRIVELPPGIDIVAFRKKLNVMEELEQIQSYQDRSTENIDILVKFKRGSVKDWKEEDAIAFFKLREKTTERITVVNWDGLSIKTYDDPTTLVREFVQWRLGWYTTRFEKLRDDASHELIYWRLLKALFDNGFTKKLGTFPNKAAMAVAVEAVAKKAKLILGEGHLDRALSLATYRWTKEFEAEVGQKITSIEADITEYISTIASPEKLKSIYMAELEALKKLKL